MNETVLTVLKTRPFNKPRLFSAVKIEISIGRNLMFLILFAQNICCGYMLEPPEAVLTGIHNLCFGSKIRKK